MKPNQADIQIKLQFWNTISQSLFNEARSFETDYKEVIKTKDPQTFRQRNIQNQISQAQELLKHLADLQVNTSAVENSINTKQSNIGPWALYKMQKLYSIQPEPGQERLKILNTPKEHFVFRFPFSISLLSSETFSPFFEKYQVSVSNSTTYDGLSLGQLFWVRETDSRNLRADESYQIFKVEFLA